MKNSPVNDSGAHDNHATNLKSSKFCRKKLQLMQLSEFDFIVLKKSTVDFLSGQDFTPTITTVIAIAIMECENG